MAVVVLLGGCADGDEQAEPSASPSSSSSPSSTPSAAASPSPSPDSTGPAAEPDAGGETASLVGVPLGVGCDVLVSPQALYDLNPNVGTDPGFDPAARALAPVALGLGGTACGYLNQTSGEKISVSAARVESGSVTDLSAEVTARGGGLNNGRAFRSTASASTLEVVTGDRWIVVEAPPVFAEEDLQPLADAARASTGG